MKKKYNYKNGLEGYRSIIGVHIQTTRKWIKNGGLEAF